MGIIWSENQYNMGPLKKHELKFLTSRDLSEMNHFCILKDKSEPEGQIDKERRTSTFCCWASLCEADTLKSENKSQDRKHEHSKCAYKTLHI